MQKITKPKKIESSKRLSFSYRNLINLTVTNKPIIDPDRKIKIRQKFKSLTAINMVVYVPSKRRIKLPDIPGIINAVTAMKPEKNKYKRFISTNSLEGKRYRKLQIQIERVNPIKNRADILGFSGSKKAEQSKMLDKKDLKKKGYSSMKNNMREEKMKIEVNIPKTSNVIKVPST